MSGYDSDHSTVDDRTGRTDAGAETDGEPIASHLRDPGVEASPDDPIDPVAEGRVVNRVGPGITEPPKSTGEETSPDLAERVPDGQGARSPHVEDSGRGEHSVYDGSGQEVVVVTTTDDSGRVAQGSGSDVDEAMKDARKGGYPAE